MTNLYVEKNNRIVQYYDVPASVVRMITNVLESMDCVIKAETEDGYRVMFQDIEKEQHDAAQTV